MTEPSLKTWKHGVVDEAWKADICKRDLTDFRKSLQLLDYILFATPTNQVEDLIDKIFAIPPELLRQKLKAYELSCSKPLDAWKPA